MDLGHQLRDRLPFAVERDLRTDVEVDAGYEEIPAWARELREVPQTPVGTRRIHVAEEVVPNHEILRSKLLNEPPIGGVPESPCDAFSQPGLDPTLIIAVPIEHLEQLGLGQPFEYGLIRSTIDHVCELAAQPLTRAMLAITAYLLVDYQVNAEAAPDSFPRLIGRDPRTLHDSLGAGQSFDPSKWEQDQRQRPDHRTKIARPQRR